MQLVENLIMLTEYKRWADNVTIAAVSSLPHEETIKPRPTRYTNMVYTLNHIYVVDDIFKAHLLGERHGYSARNTEDHPPLNELWTLQQQMDDWYINYTRELDETRLSEVVRFQFAGGGDGAMTRSSIINHIVNHSTYHRGLVSDMIYQVSATPAPSDITVFLRDIYRPQ